MAYPLELRYIDFDARSSTALVRIARTAVGVALVMGVLLLLDALFGVVAADRSVAGNALRYFTAGMAGMFAAPYLYVRLGWAGRRPSAHPLDGT